MTEFVTEITRRIRQTVRSLQEARGHGDDYLAEVRTGELESLVRLARDHGLHVPEAEPWLEGGTAAG